MKTLISFLFILALSGCNASANAAGPIFIIGDSISAGYKGPLQAILPCVERMHGNGRDSGYLLAHLSEIVPDATQGGTAYAIIHFNTGLWDLARRYKPGNPLYDPAHPWTLDPTDQETVSVTVAQYRQNLTAIVAKLRQLQPQAVLVFATTTDVPAGSIGRKAEDVGTYNTAAHEVMNGLGVQTDMLHAYMLPYAYLHVDQNGNKVHYNAVGYEMAAQHVADVLNSLGGCGP